MMPKAPPAVVTLVYFKRRNLANITEQSMNTYLSGKFTAGKE